MINILFEDDDLLFVEKPPNLVVQRAHDPVEPVLLEMVGEQAGRKLFLMQRLDRGTSGVIFFSKSAAINAKLTRQFETRRIRKRYLALTEGRLAQKQTIDAPLVRIGAIKFGVGRDGRRAVTHLEPVAAGEHGSLIRIRLETGRTHQIRVHCAAIAHPLVGDWLYGERNAERPMLHAEELAMTHPRLNTPLVVSVTPPADFIEEAGRRGLRI